MPTLGQDGRYLVFQDNFEGDGRNQNIQFGDNYTGSFDLDEKRYEKSALQTPFPELHAQKKSRLICLTIGRVDRTMFLKGTIVTNQAAHGMVTHQAAPRLILGI
mgnify:CR=1 FL=1